MSYLAARMRAISLVMACGSVGLPSASTVSKYGAFSARSLFISVVSSVMRAPTWASRMRWAAASACADAAGPPGWITGPRLGAVASVLEERALRQGVLSPLPPGSEPGRCLALARPFARLSQSTPVNRHCGGLERYLRI